MKRKPHKLNWILGKYQTWLKVPHDGLRSIGMDSHSFSMYCRRNETHVFLLNSTDSNWFLMKAAEQNKTLFKFTSDDYRPSVKSISDIEELR